MPSQSSRLPVELLSHICGILKANNDTKSLTTLMRVSGQLYDIASIELYKHPTVTETNVKGFLLGIPTDLHRSIKVVPPTYRRDYDRPQLHSFAARKRKTQLLAKTRTIRLVERPFNIRKRWNQLPRHIYLLEWILEQVMQGRTALLSNLRKIEYFGDIPHSKLFRDRKLSTTDILDPVISSPQIGLWDIGLCVSRHEEYRSEQSKGGITAIYKWLQTYANLGRIRHLQLHMYRTRLSAWTDGTISCLGDMRLRIMQPPNNSTLNVTTAGDMRTREEKKRDLWIRNWDDIHWMCRPYAASSTRKLEIFNAFGNNRPSPSSSMPLQEIVFDYIEKEAGWKRAASPSHIDPQAKKVVWFAPSTVGLNCSCGFTGSASSVDGEQASGNGHTFFTMSS